MKHLWRNLPFYSLVLVLTAACYGLGPGPEGPKYPPGASETRDTSNTSVAATKTAMPRGEPNTAPERPTRTPTITPTMDPVGEQLSTLAAAMAKTPAPTKVPFDWVTTTGKYVWMYLDTTLYDDVGNGYQEATIKIPAGAPAKVAEVRNFYGNLGVRIVTIQGGLEIGGRWFFSKEIIGNEPALVVTEGNYGKFPPILKANLLDFSDSIPAMRNTEGNCWIGSIPRGTDVRIKEVKDHWVMANLGGLDLWVNIAHLYLDVPTHEIPLDKMREFKSWEKCNAP